MEQQRVSDETLEFIYQHVVGSPDRQLAAADSADSKLVQVFATASVVFGLILATRTLDREYVVASAIFYGTAAVAAGVGLWGRSFRTARYPAVLWNDYRFSTERRMKMLLVKKIAANYKMNVDKLGEKHLALAFAIGATTAEALTFGLGIIFR